MKKLRLERKCQETFHKYHVFAPRADVKTQRVPNNRVPGKPGRPRSRGHCTGRGCCTHCPGLATQLQQTPGAQVCAERRCGFWFRDFEMTLRLPAHEQAVSGSRQGPPCLPFLHTCHYASERGDPEASSDVMVAPQLQRDMLFRHLPSRLLAGGTDVYSLHILNSLYTCIFTSTAYKYRVL